MNEPTWKDVDALPHRWMIACRSCGEDDPTTSKHLVEGRWLCDSCALDALKLIEKRGQ